MDDSRNLVEQDHKATAVHAAAAEFAIGPVRYAASARITTNGLLAVGAAASGVLLSIAVLVWAVRRRR